MHLEKIASIIEMSFEIPEAEKKEAQLACQYLEQVINAIDHATDHLDIIYQPFKQAPQLSPEAVWEYRGAIRRYKEKINENFSKVKVISLYALNHLNLFSSDTHILEINNSFRDSVEELSEKVESLLDVLDQMKDVNYKDIVIQAIEAVRQAGDKTEILIKERALDFINSNILVKNWTTDLSQDLKLELKKKEPYISQLFKERQDALGQR